jgi:hypothetical protein
MQKLQLKIDCRSLIASIIAVTVLASGCVSLEVDIDRNNLRNSDLNIITPYEMETDLKIKSDEIRLEFEWQIENVNKSLNKLFSNA